MKARMNQIMEKIYEKEDEIDELKKVIKEIEDKKQTAII
jgi:hypothetical protein